MSGEFHQSGLQVPTGHGEVQTRFTIYVDGEIFDSVRGLLSSVNDNLDGFGVTARLSVGIPLGTITVSGTKPPTIEERAKMVGIIEDQLRETLHRHGKDWPISVKAESGGAG